jgi:phage-related protein
MTDTFNWDVLQEPTGTTTLRMRSAQFGDGYAQDAADGLNPVVANWPVSVKGNAALIGPIKDFLKAHVGVSFFWTPPGAGEVQGYYQCTGYTEIPHGVDRYTLAITLQQKFKP